MSRWPSSKAKVVYRALVKIGWVPFASKGGSHVRMRRPGFPDFTWAFHDSVEIGPVMLGKIAKHTGIKPEDL